MSSPKFDRAFGNLSEAVKPHGARVSALLCGHIVMIGVRGELPGVRHFSVPEEKLFADPRLVEHMVLGAAGVVLPSTPETRLRNHGHKRFTMS